MSLQNSTIPIEEFNGALWKRYYNGKIRNVYPLAKYNDIIEKIKTMEENPPCNTPGEYYLLRKFIIVNVNGKERLTCKPENKTVFEILHSRNATQKFYVALEEIYTYLEESHKWVKHGCRDRLLRKVQSQGVVNITRDTVELFLSFCKLCRPLIKNDSASILKPSRKHVISPRLGVSKPLSDSNSDKDSSLTCNPSIVNIEENRDKSPHKVSTFTRGFMDLIDFSWTPDGENKFLFVYVDVQTCFCVLYPVRCRCIYEIVSHLLSIFTLFGAPQVLHSNFESVFLLDLISSIKRSLPDLVLVAGSLSNSNVQEVAQNCIIEVTCMIKGWMRQNSSNNWSHGLKLVQLKKNTKTLRKGSKSPYECFFGREYNSNFNDDVHLLKNIEKEDDLLALVNGNTMDMEPPAYENLQVSVDPKICLLVQNTAHLSHSEEEEDDNLSIFKSEPSSDTDVQEINGCEFRDLSNDGDLQMAIKQEEPDSF